MNDAPTLSTPSPGVARIAWPDSFAAAEFASASRTLREAVQQALTQHGRVEAWIDPDDAASQRLATWSGLLREGIARGAAVAQGVHRDVVVHARLATDPAPGDPAGFRQALNSFLPRKRTISQMLVRDEDDRVLMCELTYKPDLDLPGGVVEIGESPRSGAMREVSEELSLEIPAGDVLLADWLPAWSGWDDAMCLVFNGGRHPSDLLERAVLDRREIKALHLCTLDEIRERSADFTARRVEQALAALTDGPAFTESGRLP